MLHTFRYTYTQTHTHHSTTATFLCQASPLIKLKGASRVGLSVDEGIHFPNQDGLEGPSAL